MAYRQPKQKIADQEELQEYQLGKRTGFENGIRVNRKKASNWILYAKWEAEQNDMVRARSIMERALDEDYQNPMLWLKYTEIEIEAKNINHVRNIFDRAVGLLPRCTQLWLRYVLMEETLANYSGTRVIFNRWLEWEPEEVAWNAYIKFESRYGEADRARQVFRKYVIVHPLVSVYLKWAKFEQKLGEMANARAVLENCHEFLGTEAEVAEYFVEFAKFEESNREVERARAIYKFALDKVPKQQATDIYKAYVAFEKQHGDRDGIEVVIAGRRRFTYEEDLKSNPRNYDAWFDYARLEEKYASTPDKVRDVYERAIANVPPVSEKRFWRRYIWIWINYAVFEELDCEDVNRARAVWTECIKLIPHKQFSFSKIWIHFAHFEVRQGDLGAARKIFGNGIGRTPNPKLFAAYIELESKLGDISRVRTLYQKFLQLFSGNSQGWCDFAALEIGLQETERAKAILELAVNQPQLDSPELVWKYYIDYEIENEHWDAVRQLYGRLLQKTQHPRVWESFARFELSRGSHERAREVYLEGDGSLKTEETKSERYQLLELWKEFEEDVAADIGEDAAKFDLIKARVPKRIKKKRKLVTESGGDAGFEEYHDFLFPDMQSVAPNLKLLEAAKKWKADKARKELEQAAEKE